MKRFLIVIVAMFFITLGIGMYAKSTFHDAGLFDLKTVADVEKQTYGLEDMRAAGYFSDPAAMAESLWLSQGDSNMGSDSIITVVRATGNLSQYTCSLTQEVEILKVIKGDKSLEGKMAYINKDRGIVSTTAKYNRLSGAITSKYKVVFPGELCNLMQKNNIYLAFLVSDGLNKYYEKPYFNINGQLGGIGYFNLTSNKSFCVDKDPSEVTLQDFNGSEFLCRSEKVLEYMTELKQTMIDLARDDIDEYLSY